MTRLNKKCSVNLFIEWLNATAKLPFWIEFKVHISLLLMASTYWNETIFDNASTYVSQFNVDAQSYHWQPQGFWKYKIQMMGIN